MERKKSPKSKGDLIEKQEKESIIVIESDSSRPSCCKKSSFYLTTTARTFTPFAGIMAFSYSQKNETFHSKNLINWIS